MRRDRGKPEDENTWRASGIGPYIGMRSHAGFGGGIKLREDITMADDGKGVKRPRDEPPPQSVADGFANLEPDHHDEVGGSL